MGELGAVVLCLVLAAGMLVLLEAGFRLARRFETTRGGEETGIFDTAIFALLGLLLGFAFSGAVDRLTARRDLIVQEANAIGTAYLRVDLLPVEQQPDMRVLFRDYVSERLKLYGVIDAGGNAQAQFQRIGSIQHAIWDGAVAGVLQPERQFAAEVVLPAINDMIDITSTRRVALGT